MLTVCNEPVSPLSHLRSPRIWQAIMAADLNGKIALSEIQLNHALVHEEQQNLDKRLLALYLALVQKFGKLHGGGTRCFLARAPESLNLVGHHIREFGGSTNGIACYGTVFCVSPRKDGKVTIAHLDDNFGSLEFELAAGLPKARVLNWSAHVGEQKSEDRGQKTEDRGQKSEGDSRWCGVIKNALQYYVNRHKGPTGQIELDIPGLDIVVASLLPTGASGHSETTLAAGALLSIMAASGEWGRMRLSEFAAWLDEAQSGSHGRRSEIGPLVFGMAGEAVHTDWNPARAKTKHLAHGVSFLTAHTGVKTDCSHDKSAVVDVLKTPAVRSTVTAIGLSLYRQLVKDEGAPLNDEAVYKLIRQIPQRAPRSEILGMIKCEKTRAFLETRFKGHAEPSEGYNLREKLLYVLAEIRRADKASEVIRTADATALGALMNIGQAGEANVVYEVSALGQVEATHALPSCVNDDELLSLADQNSPLWRQSGKSGASSAETDLLCDIACAVNGVLGARYCEPQRVAILCKTEVLQIVKDTLVSGYYSPRGLPATLVEQVFACQGLGIFAV